MGTVENSDENITFYLNKKFDPKVSDCFSEWWESAFTDIPRLQFMIPVNAYQTEIYNTVHQYSRVSLKFQKA
jgi:hypothetical protein